MRHTESLKDNRVFRRLYSKGKCAAAKNVAVYWRKRPGKQNRLGLTVGTKIGKAVKRNRVRRRLYEIYRLCGPNIKAGFDIVIVAPRSGGGGGIRRTGKGRALSAEKSRYSCGER